MATFNVVQYQMSRIKRSQRIRSDNVHFYDVYLAQYRSIFIEITFIKNERNKLQTISQLDSTNAITFVLIGIYHFSFQ